MLLRPWFASIAIVVFAGASALAQCQQSGRADTAVSAAAQEQAGARCAGDSGQAATGKTCWTAGTGAGAQCPGTCDGKNCAPELARFKGLGLPRLVYVVNETSLCCPESAEKLAKEQNAQIRYVVAGQTYADRNEALAAHAAELERFLTDALTVKYAVGDECVACPQTAQELAQKLRKPLRFRLASFDFADRDSAEKAAEKARAASQAVQMKMMVGEKSFCCPDAAAQAAKAEGKPIDYCVGQATTRCQATAKVQLALQRIKAALETLEQNGGMLASSGA